MKKIVLLVILFILAFLLGFFISRIAFTGNGVTGKVAKEKEYSWTKAICNENNECLDVVIYCRDDKAVKIAPVSGIIRHSSEWVDPRNQTELCE